MGTNGIWESIEKIPLKYSSGIRELIDSTNLKFHYIAI